jgi:hypothetical protein
MIAITMIRASPQRILELVVVLVLTFLFMNFWPSVLLDHHRLDLKTIDLKTVDLKTIDLKTFDTIVGNIAFLLPIYFVL